MEKNKLMMGLSTLEKMNAETEANTAAIAKLNGVTDGKAVVIGAISGVEALTARIDDLEAKQTDNDAYNDKVDAHNAQIPDMAEDEGS